MKNILKLLLTSSILILFSACTTSAPNFSDNASAQQKTETIDEWLSELHQQGKFNGVVLYAKEGEVQYTNNKGYIDFEQSALLNSDSAFNLASVSKQFTATAIMLLKQDGKLDYDKPVQSYISELPYSNITVRHLLTHTSGIRDYMDLAEQHWDESKLLTNEDMIGLIKKFNPPLAFEPGSKFEYSNTGYVTLATIVERVSGMSFESFMQQRVFTPLGMKNSRVLNLLSESKDYKPRVFGFDDKGVSDLVYLDGVAGDGAVYASANDLLIWDQAILTNKLISADEQAQAFAPFELNDGEKSYYGFGWGLQEDKSAVSHSGGWVGFRTYIRRNKDEQSLIVILTNNSYGKSLRPIRDTLQNAYE